MYAMASEMFAEWLQARMDFKGYSQAELARLAGVSRAAINGVLTGVRGPGTELCSAIARGLKIHPATVFRAAGLLPPEPDQDETSEEINYKLSRLPRQVREQIAEYVDYVYERHVQSNADEITQSDR